VLRQPKLVNGKPWTLDRGGGFQLGNGHDFGAYEIHLGVTTVRDTPVRPFARLEDGSADGMKEDRLIATYLHGALKMLPCAQPYSV
jgi:cobyric acid synthase